jgi:hypothetical protein
MGIVAGLFERFEDADRAVHDLEHFGYCSGNIRSIGAPENATEKRESSLSQATMLPAIIGAVWGGLTGLLFGIGPLALPEIEAGIYPGALTAMFASTTFGAGFGAISGGLLGALVRRGIPELDSKVHKRSKSIIGVQMSASWRC